MKHKKSASITEHFSSLTDPSIDRNKQHKLLDIILITICAVISGADGWEAIENYGNAKKNSSEIFRNYLWYPFALYFREYLLLYHLKNFGTVL